MNTNLTESSSAPLTETPEEISRRRFFEKLSIALGRSLHRDCWSAVSRIHRRAVLSEGAQGMGHARQAR